MINPGPVCSVCTTDCGERLGYCERCAQERDERSNANTPGLWEDNFS